MIPKVIHYCRFGTKEKPELVKQCISSRKKYCPDFKIKERNESNCNININKRTKSAYKNKKRAFVSDYFRLKALYEYGGIYLDTDMELTNTLEEVIQNECFRGFDSRKILSAGIIGTKKGNVEIKEIMDIYKKKSFDGTTINHIITPYYQKKWLLLNGKEQIIEHTKFYKSNKVSIDLNDGENIVKDHHMNSRNNGRRVDHNARVYLEYLAIEDEKIGTALNEIYATYEKSYIRKIGTIIIKIIEKLKLMSLANWYIKKIQKK